MGSLCLDGRCRCTLTQVYGNVRGETPDLSSSASISLSTCVRKCPGGGPPTCPLLPLYLRACVYGNVQGEDPRHVLLCLYISEHVCMEMSRGRTPDLSSSASISQSTCVRKCPGGGPPTCPLLPLYLRARVYGNVQGEDPRPVLLCLYISEHLCTEMSGGRTPDLSSSATISLSTCVWECRGEDPRPVLLCLYISEHMCVGMSGGRTPDLSSSASISQSTCVRKCPGGDPRPVLFCLYISEHVCMEMSRGRTPDLSSSASISQSTCVWKCPGGGPPTCPPLPLYL
jgi:hypothetical protein